MNDKERFRELINLDYPRAFQKATEGFLGLLLSTNRSYVSDLDIYFQLGNCYYFSNYYEEAFSFFTKATKEDESYEAASLGVYLSLVKLDRTDEAIVELDKFASNHPINLYRDTIEELIEGLNNNIGTDFRPIIITLAKKHNIL